MNTVSKWLMVLITAACATLTTIEANAQSYSLTVLGPGDALAINDNDQVAGVSCTDTTDTACSATVWNGSTPTVLGLLPSGTGAGANGINNLGQVVGVGRISGNFGAPVPTLWNGTTPTALGTLSGTTGYGVALGINDSGQIVGYVGTPDGGTLAILWNGTTPTGLPPLGSFASAINNSGQVVGGVGPTIATVWNGTTPTNLPPPSGLGVPFPDAQAHAINNAGQIVGYSSSSLGNVATLWNGTTPTALGLLSGTNNDAAEGINDVGQVVGQAQDSTGLIRAVLWIGTTPIDLNSVLSASDVNAGWFLWKARAINSKGMIVGQAFNSQLGGTSGSTYAFVLTPIPLTLACPVAAAQVAVPYSSALTAAGGIPPDTFSISTGSLPPVLSLNTSTGAVTGTPSTAGPFSFTGKVVDSSGIAAGTVTAACTITVSPAPLQLSVTGSLNFGTVPRFSLLYKTVTLKNTGTSAVSIGKVSVTPGAGADRDDFWPLSFCPSSLAVGKSCSIIVVFFAEHDLGSLSATLNIPNNATGSPQTVPISATVTKRKRWD